MDIITLPLQFEGSTGEKIVNTLFDISTTFSCLRPDIAKAIGKPMKLKKPLEVVTAAEGKHVEITEVVLVDFYQGDVRMSDEFMVVPGLANEAVIGMNTMQKWRIKIDFKKDTISVDPRTAKHTLRSLS